MVSLACNQKFFRTSINMSLKTQEKKTPQGKFLESFLLDNRTTIF